MLTRLRASGFKSLNDLEIEFPRLTVLFGPNASGKSNIIEAALMLSRIATSRTLPEAFREPVRGYPFEAFTFPPGGLPDLLSQERVRFSLEADIGVESDRFNYRIGVELRPTTGSLLVHDEYLGWIGRKRKPQIETQGRKRYLHPLHRGRPPGEDLPVNYAALSDRRLVGTRYDAIEACRGELENWRVYYLEPRRVMRGPASPADVSDIGMEGRRIAPYLYRLKAQCPTHFAAIKRTLKTIIPGIEDLKITLDEMRGTLDIEVLQDGRRFSSRIISEGTLRVLGLCAIVANPWPAGLIAFEEPENGVHPRRLELIAQLLVSLALEQGKQVIVTTHSPLFCDTVLKLTRDCRDDVALLSVRCGRTGTEVRGMEFANGLFHDEELASALSAPGEDGLFEALLLRGWLDG